MSRPAKRQKAIKRGLDRAYDDEQTEEIARDLSTARLIVFSDHHKGSRDGADDFRRCERAYNAALAHYLRLGHELVVLGDAEELWECRPEEVLPEYDETLTLERRFHELGRYHRFWGNHDDLWRTPKQVGDHLRTFAGLRVREALKLALTEDGSRRGLLFLVHGHQGTLDSDKWGWLSRVPVRLIWRNIQRWTNIPSTTPAKDWELRNEHDTAMFKWAGSHRDKPILIAGHTHRPVFADERPKPKVERPADEIAGELEAAERSGTATPGELAALHAELEFTKAEVRRIDPPTVSNVPPCYFNTGCCSFGDGDVTGLEIADGEIRLVRWPDDDHRPRPKTLASRPLREIVDAVARS